MNDLRTQLQTTLGDGYTLERELGGGGMSRVFVARENALGREVVVKVLSPDLAASVSAERFTREIATAARLKQANIVPVLAAGTSGGVSYYTMPFVKGESLRALLSSGGPMPMHDRLNVLRDVARALAYAHTEGVIHRDIKPDNILLSSGTAVVTDFGIAKAISASRTEDGSTTGANDGTLTQVGSSIGTPAYMAPEQAVGESIDHRADLYAWGVVAYELLSGAHPFAGKSGTSQLIAAHIAETPVSLATRNAEIPRDVVALVMQCLEKNPAQRPENASALLTRLSNTVTPSADVAAADTRASRMSLRSWLTFAVPAVAVLALIAWAVMRQRSGADRARTTASGTADSAAIRSVVVLPFESVGGDTANVYFAEGMADELSNALTKVPGLQLTARSSAAAFRGKSASVQAIGTALNVGAVLEGTVRRAGARLRVSAQLTNARTAKLLWSESYERDAKDVFAVQDDIAKAIVSALRVTLAGGTANAVTTARGTDDLVAYDLYQRGMYLFQRRGPGLVRAREYFEQAVARDPRFARAFAALGLTWIQLAIYTDVWMINVLPQAAAASERAVALDSTSVDSWAALGVARTYQHQWRAADEATARAVRLDARSAIAQLFRARFLAAVGRVDEAAEAAVWTAALDPVSVGGLINAQLILALAGRYPEAVELGNRAWEIDSTLGGGPGLIIITQLEGGQIAEAKRRAEVVLTISTDPGGVSRAIYVIAKTGDTARAVTLLRRQSARFADRLKSAASFSTAWTGVGDTANALTQIEESTRRGEFGVTTPLGSRMYDPLRASPRFAAIVRSLGLDVALFTSPNGGRPR